MVHRRYDKLHIVEKQTKLGIKICENIISMGFKITR